MRMQRKELLYTVGKNVNQYIYYGKWYEVFQKKKKTKSRMTI